MTLQTILTAVFVLALGSAVCFYGYRMLWILLPVWGFLAGLWLGASGVTYFLGDGFLATLTGWLVGFVVGAIFAFLSYIFYFVGVALLSATIGFWLVTAIGSSIGLESGILLLILGIASAVFMVALVFYFNLQKYIVIVLTSLGGAGVALTGIQLLIGRIGLESLQVTWFPVFYSPLAWLAWVFLSVAGLYAQIQSSRNYTLPPPRGKPSISTPPSV